MVVVRYEDGSFGIKNFKIIQKGETLYLYGTTNRYYYKQLAEYWTAKRSGMGIKSQITVVKEETVVR
jgi:hypothetical protein